ncbi:MAG: hypothetical protein QOJ11_2964 [Frankiales bacterium]|jgi:NTE family protein|nr:hypothetical protein [Frankiales bacterium]
MSEPDLPVSIRYGVGLCLSGGGYRAMLFHIGCLRRLAELGWLPRLDFVSSVSGGSITAAALALAWGELADEQFSPAAFTDHVEAPLRNLASTNIDTKAVLGGLVKFDKSISSRVVAALDDGLFHCATLQELPDAPRFIFNATNLQTGSLLRFSKPYLRDYQVARIVSPNVPLATAVAASAAFPPFLSPLRLEVNPSLWDEIEPAPAGVVPWPPRELVLTDGGVYDNLGLEPVWKRCGTVLVSDGGGQMGYAADVANDWLRHLRRVLSVVDNQVRDLRKRTLIADYRRQAYAGAYWGIRTDIVDYGLPAGQALLAPLTATRRLAAIPTRLAAMDRTEQAQLINWGYAVTDAAMRRHLPDPSYAAPVFPCPGGVGQA